jgi:hypothetical protein
MRRISIAFVLVLGGLVAVPAGAHAATTLGENFEPDGCAPDTYIQTSDPGSRYTVPFDGVITRFSYQSDATPPSQFRFKVGRIASGADLSLDTDVTITGQSNIVAPVASTVNTYQAQIPVTAGDKIGEFTTTDCSRQDPEYTDHFFEDDVQPGTTELFSQETYQQDISAVLEKDCDRDGLGDETQDPDISSCTPPQATGQRAAAKKRCKKKHKGKEQRKKRRKCIKRAKKLPV